MQRRSTATIGVFRTSSGSIPVATTDLSFSVNYNEKIQSIFFLYIRKYLVPFDSLKPSIPRLPYRYAIMSNFLR